MLLVVLSLPCYCSGLLLLTLSPLCWMVFSLPTCSKLHLSFSVQFTGYPFHVTLLDHPWDILWHFIFTSVYLFFLSFIYSVYIPMSKTHQRTKNFHCGSDMSVVPTAMPCSHSLLHMTFTLSIASELPTQWQWMHGNHPWPAIPAIRWISFELFC